MFVLKVGGLGALTQLLPQRFYSRIFQEIRKCEMHAAKSNRVTRDHKVCFARIWIRKTSLVFLEHHLHLSPGCIRANKGKSSCKSQQYGKIHCHQSQCTSTQRCSRHVCIRKSDELCPHSSDASLQNLSELKPVHISAKPNPIQESQHDRKRAFLLSDSKSLKRQLHNLQHSWIKQILTAQLHLTKELLFFSESSNGPCCLLVP